MLHLQCLFYQNFAVLPRGRNFGLKTAEKNVWGPGKYGAELLADLSKKGPNIFVARFCIKTVIFWQKIVTQMTYSIFQY
jgi:hypothetical protein